MKRKTYFIGIFAIALASALLKVIMGYNWIITYALGATCWYVADQLSIMDQDER